jgi:hypothetical protein
MHYDPFPFCLLAIYIKWFWASEMEARKVEYTAVRNKGTENENRVDEEAYGRTVVLACSSHSSFQPNFMEPPEATV